MMTEHVHLLDKLFLRLAETANKACKLLIFYIEYLTLPMLGHKARVYAMLRLHVVGNTY
jgi:hypothetical protein